MFATASLAKRIEGAEVGLILEGVQVCARRVPADRIVVVVHDGDAGSPDDVIELMKEVA